MQRPGTSSSRPEGISGELGRSSQSFSSMPGADAEQTSSFRPGQDPHVDFLVASEEDEIAESELNFSLQLGSAAAAGNAAGSLGEPDENVGPIPEQALWPRSSGGAGLEFTSRPGTASSTQHARSLHGNSSSYNGADMNDPSYAIKRPGSAAGRSLQPPPFRSQSSSASSLRLVENSRPGTSTGRQSLRGDAPDSGPDIAMMPEEDPASFSVQQLVLQPPVPASRYCFLHVDTHLHASMCCMVIFVHLTLPSRVLSTLPCHCGIWLMIHIMLHEQCLGHLYILAEDLSGSAIYLPGSKRLKRMPSCASQSMSVQ